MNKFKSFCFVLFFISIPKAVIASEDIKIIDFLTDTLWLCSSDEDCVDTPKSELPDPTKNPLVVTKYDENAEMVAVNIEGKETWFDKTEVQLNKKALASVRCATQSITRNSDSKTYASFGLGEGCK